MQERKFLQAKHIQTLIHSLGEPPTLGLECDRVQREHKKKYHKAIQRLQNVQETDPALKLPFSARAILRVSQLWTMFTAKQL